MNKFELVLKNEKEKSHRIFTLFLLAINLLSILFISFSAGFNKAGPLIFSFLALFSAFAGFYFKRNYETATISAAFFFFSIAWESHRYRMISVLNLVFLILHLVTSRKRIVKITEENIVYPVLTDKTIPWKDLNNIILKDNLLTIDFKNNKLFQQMIDDSASAIDEKEFNDFCISRLSR